MEINQDDLDYVYLSEIDDPKPKVRSAIVKVSTTGSTSSVEPAVDLFPNPPRRIKPENIVVELSQPNQNRGKHVQNRAKQLFRSKPNRRAPRPADANIKKLVLKSKYKHQQKFKAERSVQLSESINRPNDNRRCTATATSNNKNQNNQKSVFSRLDSHHIPISKETNDAETQTELSGPCRCTLRNRAKNQNRRQAYKLSRDLVKQFNL